MTRNGDFGLNLGVKIFLYILATALWVANARAQTPNFPGGIGGFPGAGGMQQGSSANPSGGIDDSTKVIYGPKTSRYFLESDVLNNRKTLYPLDTLIEGFHAYNFVQRSQNRLVDLGNFGTASRPVFFAPAQNLGTLMGFNAYTPYMYQPDSMRYFDTKSPFSNLYFVMGGLGQNVFRVDMNQNIKKRWNFGFNAQRMSANKQFGTSGRTDSEQRLIENWAFVLHSNYRSADEKYMIMGNYSNLSHFSRDQGGVAIEAVNGVTDFFPANAPAALLDRATTFERRNRLHIYHQYKLSNGFQAFQTVDYQSQSNIYKDLDVAGSLTKRFYKNVVLQPKVVNPDVRFRAFETKFGLKGQYRGFDYRTHLRTRVFGQTDAYAQTDSIWRSSRRSGFQNFVGLWLSYHLKDSTQRVEGEVEYLPGGDFKLKADLHSRWFSAGYHVVASSPTFLQQQFRSNILSWQNDFRLVTSNQIYGQINYQTKHLSLRPSLEYSLISNYIYFDTNTVARQFTGNFSLIQVGLGWQTSLGRFRTLGQVYYTDLNNNSYLRIPKLFANLRLSYDFKYAKVLFINAGIDLHYKSTYFADAYTPLTQQFYLQDRIAVQGYVIADVFANLRINRVRLLLKMAHVNSGVLAPGYFTTPLFAGVGRHFSFGVNWPLFD